MHNKNEREIWDFFEFGTFLLAHLITWCDVWTTRGARFVTIGRSVEDHRAECDSDYFPFRRGESTKKQFGDDE